MLRSLKCCVTVCSLVSAVGFSGCSSNPISGGGGEGGGGAMDPEVVGAWELTEMEVKTDTLNATVAPGDIDFDARFTFNSDNTYSATITIEGDTDAETGTWRTNGDMLHFDDEGSIRYSITSGKMTWFRVDVMLGIEDEGVKENWIFTKL